MEIEYGYVKYIEHWGSDERIIESARMSTGKGFQGWEPKTIFRCSRCKLEYPNRTDECITTLINYPTHDDEPIELAGDMKLLRYLYEHHHLTPFEMAGATFEIQAPIFVFREWHRHRTQSYNEMSSRYIELPDMYYIPSIARAMAVKQSKTNKQGTEVEAQFSIEEGQAIRLAINEAHRNARQVYENLLGLGIAREIARVVLPVAQFSRMRASANLRNWMQFLTLRTSEDAQWEIRMYANEVYHNLQQHFPRTLGLWKEGHVHG